MISISIRTVYCPWFYHSPKPKTYSTLTKQDTHIRRGTQQERRQKTQKIDDVSDNRGQIVTESWGFCDRI